VLQTQHDVKFSFSLYLREAQPRRATGATYKEQAKPGVCWRVLGVMQLVKGRNLRNKYFPDFATFRGSIDFFMDSLNGINRHLLKSLITENFQMFEIPKL